LLELGIAAIYQHVQTYLDQLESALVDRGFRSLRASDPEARSGSLSVGVPEGTKLPHLHGALSESGIVTSLPDGYLRFSPHWPNAIDEIPTVLHAIDAALRR
jgi:selenocysteine lyase/cysteine desulfurase